MLKEFEGQMPKIDKKAHAFESADLIGKVEMKEYSLCQYYWYHHFCWRFRFRNAVSGAGQSPDQLDA